MPVNMDKVLAQKALLDSRGQKVPYMKLKEGANVVRILPPFGNKEVPWMEFAVCFNIGPPNMKRSFTPRAQFGLDCPLQKYIEVLQSRGDIVSKKEIDHIKPKNKFHLFVIDRENEAEGPKHLTLPPKCLADILTIMADPDFGDITHPDLGTDISINYKKPTSKSFAEYHVSPKRNRSPIVADPTMRQLWLSVDLFEKYRVGVPADADYITAVLNGTVDAYVAAKKGEAAPPDLADSEDDAEGAANLPSNATATAFPFGANAAPAQVAAAAPPAAQVQTSGFVAPPAAAVPQPVATLPTVQHPFPAEQPFWVVQNGTAVQMSAAKIAELVLAAQDPMIMNGDQTGAWGTASSRGFKLVRPEQPVAVAPPPPPMVPASPPAAPVPPPVSSLNAPLPGDEAAALQQQLASFSVPSGQPQSAVSADLLAAMKK